MLKVFMKASEVCKLTINKDKRVILIFNNESNEDTTDIGGIPVSEETKYLSIMIASHKKKTFQETK